MAYYPPYFNRGNYINPMQTAPQMPMQNVQPVTENQQYIPPYQMQTVSTNDMLWVLNEAEATAYPVAPNNSVVLWDKSNPVIYVKSVNMQGVPSMRVLDFTERTQNEPQKAVQSELNLGNNFVTVDAFNALKGDFEQLKTMFSDLKEKAVTQTVKTNKSTKKSEADE